MVLYVVPIEDLQGLQRGAEYDTRQKLTCFSEREGEES
jgi:hypothetical protein